jgi:hypothetical protein
MAKRAAASKAAPPPDVIDVPAVQEPLDLVQALREGGILTNFVTGMRQFFTRAADLEQQAKADLERAKSWQLPRSQAADEAICAYVRQNTEAKKEVEEHWQITAYVHKFHRRLTAHRDRAVKVREEIAEIGNRLHNVYLRDEQERVWQENKRLQREEEDRARKQRETELAELERIAVEREASSPQLSEREQLFVTFYYATGNARNAAQRAGYKDADVQSMRLVKSAKIQQAITAREEADAARRQAEAKRAMPIITDDVPEVKAAVDTGDRTTRSADLFDEAAFIAAVLDGTSPVPKADLQLLLTVRPTALNGYARQMGTAINAWPGVRLKSTTRIV